MKEKVFPIVIWRVATLIPSHKVVIMQCFLSLLYHLEIRYYESFVGNSMIRIMRILIMSKSNF
jgi:hypothetical protein